MTVKLAICGLGLIGRRHAEMVLKAEGVSLAGVVEPGEAGRAHAAALGAPCYDDLPALFAAEKPDGLIIATPTGMHIANARDALAARCPVLIEKPIGADRAEAEALVSDAEAAKLPLLTGHHRRHNPIIAAACDEIARGGVGDVRAVQMQTWFYKPDHYFDEAPWRAQKGAGPVSTNMVHDADLMRAFCGDALSVTAHSAPARRGYENEDIAAAIIQFKNGAIGTLTVSDAIASPWSWEMTSREDPAFPQGGRNCYYIGGSKGALSIPDLTLWTHEDGAQDWRRELVKTRLTPDQADPLLRQIENFRDVIRGEAAPVVTGRDGLAALAIVEAVQISAREGRTVQL